MDTWSLSRSPLSRGQCRHVRVHGLLSCFKGFQPCESSPLDVILGSSKCFFTCEVGERTRVGFSPVGWFVQRGETAAEPATLPGDRAAATYNNMDGPQTPNVTGKEAGTEKQVLCESV